MQDDDFAYYIQELLDAVDLLLSNDLVSDQFSKYELDKIKLDEICVKNLLEMYRKKCGFTERRTEAPPTMTREAWPAMTRKRPAKLAIPAMMAGVLVMPTMPGFIATTGTAGATTTGLATLLADALVPIATAAFFSQLTDQPKEATAYDLANDVKRYASDLLRDFVGLDRAKTIAAMSSGAADPAAIATLTTEELIGLLINAVNVKNLGLAIRILTELLSRFPQCAELIKNVKSKAMTFHRLSTNPSIGTQRAKFRALQDLNEALKAMQFCIMGQSKLTIPEKDQ